ncbi:Kinase superfamily protein, putative [Theobroma cacao]|uniref:Kinase superfamily protein, putative n=1 Tax=Theobroma cacao TaxID=3641 RepID=A0A061G1P5_THECC|nr:Kinase superfamily protein, putative [Theobroma cacao]
MVPINFSLEMYLSFFCLLLMLIYPEHGSGLQDCPELSWGSNGTAIRFPFRLKGMHPESCGYPGFDLSCTEKNQTLLELPHSVRVFVERIDYQSQEIYTSHPDGCSKGTPKLEFVYFSLPVQVDDISKYPLSSCTKLYSGSYPDGMFLDILPLKWTEPMCGFCEQNGKHCRLKNDSTVAQIERFDAPIKAKGTKGTMRKLVTAGVVLGSRLVVIAIIAVYYLYSSNKMRKENDAKIEKFLEDHRSLKPSRYSYADIKRITNQFKEKLGEGAYGTVFKGTLSSEIHVAVKILNSSIGDGEEFINEIGTMGRIHRVNVVRLVGFCADGFRRALVYEFLPNESLEKLIFSSDGRQHSLGWEKLLDIAIGIAKGIEYLHQGCDQRILHFDIKPHNILLDEKFNPKISDFGLAKLCSKDQSIVSMTAARGTMGYIAPEVYSRNFGNVSYKSDVYSFGMLILEMVGGRKNVDVTVESASQVYFPEWAYSRLNQGDELIIRIEEDGHANIAKRLTIVGLWCIQWYPVGRPSMKNVVQMLEGEGDNLSMPPNPFGSTGPIRMNPSMPVRNVHQESAVISETE